ncbi:MAG: hypothetical protein K2X81_02915 [Candidatus Obscuribacterales bacterium]|nr:hypothetical protein [Candidatus Obscuribacterales bacterium]
MPGKIIAAIVLGCPAKEISIMTEPLKEEGDNQDNFVEAHEPAELVMCIILGAAFVGLGKYCFEPLRASGNWNLLINIEGFFLTIALLSILVGLRPYLSPSSLQLSHRGLKYRGPYWPQRKTVNWDQIYQIYISPELIVVLYHPKPEKKHIWPLLIQSIYLADKERVALSFLNYCPVNPIILKGPSWQLRLISLCLFGLLIIWILQNLGGHF